MKVFTLSCIYRDGDDHPHAGLISLHLSLDSAKAVALRSWRETRLRDVTDQCSNNPDTQEAIRINRQTYNDRVLTGLPHISYSEDEDIDSYEEEQYEYQIIEVEVLP